MRSLGSDNHSGVHPKILNAMVKINTDHDSSYGTDFLSQNLEEMIRKKIGYEWSAYHCFNGTAANVLSLKSLAQSHNSILCTDCSHLNLDECGAPEFHIGAKLITVPHQNGKINLEAAKEKIIRLGDQHHSQIKALSITQPTELGTCYGLKEIKEIRNFCDEYQLYFHIDGARLPNACYTLGVDFKKIIKTADAVSFGGTKNGLLGSELVLIKKNLSKDFKFIRKQSMQLPSKTRFLSAQFIEFFTEDLYMEIAKNSCDTATYLADLLYKVCDIKPNYPVESNSVFINLPKKAIKLLKKHMFFYVWNPHQNEIRLMTSFDSNKKELKTFVSELLKILQTT